MVVRNPTQWYPPSGSGYVVTVGNLPIVTNALLPIVDNTVTHLPIVTTPTYTVPRYKTAWTVTGV